MKSWLNKDRLLAGTIIAGVSALGMAGPAMAQGGTSDEIIVTGSRIPQPNLITTSPVTQVTAQDVSSQGVTRLEDLINQLPQAFAAQNSTVSNGSTGSANINLRGLGSPRTLVLIDGRRMPYGNPFNSAADINAIPTTMVERVEILTGGASAVYGSDAVAGVVNFIMRKDFEGLELDGQYGFYSHHNDFGGPGVTPLRDVIAARGPPFFVLPDDDVEDGYSRQISALLGVSTADQRGNITAYVEYRQNTAVLQGDRDYSACAINAGTGTSFTCGGSSTAFPGRFTDFSTFDYTIDAATGDFRNWTSADQYNYGPLNYYQRPDERYLFGAFGHYEFNEHFEVYAQLMFTDYFSKSQIAPSGDFFVTGTINCDNPLLSASQSAAIGCSAADITAGTIIPMYIGRRNVEGGGRQNNLQYETYRMVGGLRGSIVDGWDYDIAAQWSRVTLTSVYLNDFSSTRLGRAIDVIDVGGVPTCRSVVDGSDPNCVPWDIFTIGNVTQDALDYLQIPLIQVANMDQQVVTATVNGDLASIGLKSPLAESGFQTAFGIEYRRDVLDSLTDVPYQTFEGAGQGGPILPVSGSVDSTDLFAELRIPLVEQRPFFELMSLDLAYRYSDYSTGTTTDTYKIGGDWAPTEDIRFRASYQRAVRSPNIIELFTAQGFNLFDMDEDPCGPDGDGDLTNQATLADCVATGVPAAQYGSAALTSPAGQYNFLQGGNPDLDPEIADTDTIGVVFTPRFLEGLTLSVDWFRIKIDDTISIRTPPNTLNACYQLGDAASCALINRNALGQLWVGTGHVVATNVNIGGLKTAGYDINLNYRVDLEDLGMGNAGRLSFALTGTLIDYLITDEGPGTVPFECVGFYSSSCGTPNPEWRHRFRVGWETPWDLDLMVTWRHYGEVELFGGGAGRLDGIFDAQDYFDVAGTYTLNEHARFRAGVNNVADDDPPISGSVGTTGNGNTFPQTYDALGRFIFAGVTVNF